MKRIALMMALWGSMGCGAVAEEADDLADDLAADSVDATDKADGILRPVGTYRKAGSEGNVGMLVLMTDRTYHLRTLCPANAACDRPFWDTDGTYQYTKSGSTRYIRLQSSSDAVTRYAYRLAGDVLSIRRTNTSTYVTLERSPDAWCAASEDCKVQNLAFPRCVGRVTCESSVCGYDCGAL